MKTHTVVFTSEEVNVILRGLTFALDMGQDTYFAFYPGQGGYSDGDQERDERARTVAQDLRERLGEYAS